MMLNKFVRGRFNRIFTFLVLCSVTFAANALPVAEAAFDLDSGMVCFPMENLSDGNFYATCLALEKESTRATFSLASLEPAQYQLANIPTYRQKEGLLIPCVRFSDGRVYADVRMKLTVDAATAENTFEVVSARRLRSDPAHSTARLWSEAMLAGIRLDIEKPPVHARDLFHTTAAMYDAWTVFDGGPATPYMLGKSLNGHTCDFSGFPTSSGGERERRAAVSYAAYTLLKHRFANIPRAADAIAILDDMMLYLGLDAGEASRDYSRGSGAALGNHIADCYIAYGLQDGSNEAGRYASDHYQPVNQAFKADQIGNPGMTDPDRWQPISFEEFRDKNGNVFLGSAPEFVTPEWGRVLPFALSEVDLSVYQRDGTDWFVYHDPGPQALLGEPARADEYRWNHQFVVLWSSHLDAHDNVLVDISPNSIGNIPEYPATLAGLHDHYNETGGGDTSRGYDLNPATGAPYDTQIVPRGDYARALVEFYGPDSDTMPGRWISVFNTLSDHPLMQKRFRGTGPELDDLEWDLKAYFTLSAAMHDAAIVTWGIKGWYDSSRPVSALRYMADRGQSSDPDAPNYAPDGIGLVPGYIETVEEGDPLAGDAGEHVGKIKFYAWKGTWQVPDPETDVAGVGWILAEEWVPYMRPSFVTPPFGGYISGHSTFARAVAEIMTLFTGDAFHPGGLREVTLKSNTYLNVERGPSTDITLQWATYRDMADQAGLARIWGGVHPPMDDIIGRNIGAVVGTDAFLEAERYFTGLSGI